MAITVSLEECPIGLFMSGSGSLCVKTEYGDNDGRIDAYIVASGEYFWGGTSTPADQRHVQVTPVRASLLSLRAASPADSFCDNVVAEVARAMTLYPAPNPNLAALTEGVGELAKAVLDAYVEQRRAGVIDTEYWDNIREEAVQVAAMACRIVMEGDPTMSVVPE